MEDHEIQKLYRRYESALEDWQIKLAIARMLRYGVPEQAWEDTMQELAIIVLKFSYEPAKARAASERTILCRRMDNRIRMLARSNARYQELLERVAAKTQANDDEFSTEESASDREVRQVVEQLTPLQQEICYGLMGGMGALELAEATGRHFTTIYRHIEFIRQAFIDRGFDKWFN